MRSIQTNPMIFMSDRLSVAFSFSRRAHLLTTRRWRAVVSLPSVGIVRSPRGLRLLRQPYGQCHSTGELLSLSTQLSPSQPLCVCEQRYNLYPVCDNCLQKPAAGSFPAEMDGTALPSIFSFAKEKQKNEKTGVNEIWRFTIWRRRW